MTPVESDVPKLYSYIDMSVYMFERFRVIVSMLVICYASDIIEYDRRTPELSNAPLHVK